MTSCYRLWRRDYVIAQCWLVVSQTLIPWIRVLCLMTLSSSTTLTTSLPNFVNFYTDKNNDNNNNNAWQYNKKDFTMYSVSWNLKRKWNWGCWQLFCKPKEELDGICFGDHCFLSSTEAVILGRSRVLGGPPTVLLYTMKFFFIVYYF